MENAELKENIFKNIDCLDDRDLIEINGIILNYINQKDNVDEWNSLTEAQQTGIYKAIDSIQKGEGILHEDVINKYRSKYS